MGHNEQIESIERIVNEIEAIQLIFEDGDDDSAVVTRVLIKSQDEYDILKDILQSSLLSSHEHHIIEMEGPKSLKITLEIVLEIKNTSSTSSPLKAVAHFALSLGYPINTPAQIYIISIDSLNILKRDKIAAALNENSKLKIGYEALLDLIQDFKHIVIDTLQKNETEITNKNEDHDDSSIINTIEFSRRWIWVHHISNKTRCTDIVEEAKSHSLFGFLKSGYPGVILIEGTAESCDAFVNWIKGSKSRPGGFGRNWGHHVRGQFPLTDKERKLINCSSVIAAPHEKGSFNHLGEDMKAFAAACKECGVENEFLKHVMQH